MLGKISDLCSEFSPDNAKELVGIIQEYISLSIITNQRVPDFMINMLAQLDNWHKFTIQELEELMNKIKQEHYLTIEEMKKQILEMQVNKWAQSRISNIVLDAVNITRKNTQNISLTMDDRNRKIS